MIRFGDFFLGSHHHDHNGPSYEEQNGFYVTPDGLFVPQQYMYFNAGPEQQQVGAAPPIDTTAVKDMIKKQIEYYFSEDNLVGDFYLRQQVQENLTISIYLAAETCSYFLPYVGTFNASCATQIYPSDWIHIYFISVSFTNYYCEEKNLIIVPC